MVHRLLMVFQTGPPRTLLAMGSLNVDTMTGKGNKLQAAPSWREILNYVVESTLPSAIVVDRRLKCCLL